MNDILEMMRALRWGYRIRYFPDSTTQPAHYLYEFWRGATQESAEGTDQLKTLYKAVSAALKNDFPKEKE